MVRSLQDWLSVDTEARERMTQNAREFLAFLAFAFGWSILCGQLIGLAHPAAVFGVWLLGFVWGVGYIVSGKRTADYFVIVWLAPPTVVAALVYLASVLIEMV